MIGIAVGITAGVVISAVIVFIVLRKKKMKTDPRNRMPASAGYSAARDDTIDNSYRPV